MLVDTYLGDAVYCRFDGFQYMLTLDDHEALTMIYMQPEVVEAFIRFVQKTTATKQLQAVRKLNDPS